MKEKTKGFVIGVLATVAVASVINVAAEEIYKNVAIAYNNIKICIDGTYLEPKDANGNPVEPFTMDGTTYLPVRAVAGAFGKEVDWDGETNTVYLGAKPGENKYSRTNPAPIGTTQTVKIDTYTEKYTAAIAVKEVIRGAEAWEKIKAANMFNSEPKDGFEYMLVKVSATISDVSDDASVNLGAYSFDFFATDYSSYDTTIIVAPDPAFGGTLYSGGSSEGYIVATVKKDDATPTMQFGSDYQGKGGIWFALTK